MLGHRIKKHVCYTENAFPNSHNHFSSQNVCTSLEMMKLVSCASIGERHMFTDTSALHLQFQMISSSVIRRTFPLHAPLATDPSTSWQGRAY